MVEVRLIREHAEDIAVRMEEDATVARLKEKVGRDHSLPVDHLHIKQRGYVVGNDLTLQNLKPPGSDTLILQLDVRYVLTVEVYTGSSFDLEVSSQESVENLMTTISRHSRVSFYKQEVVYDGSVLEPGKRIDEYGVPNRAVLVVKLRNYRTMVFVKTLDGRTIVLHVHAHDTVDGVKQLIQGQENIPAAKQRLIFVGDQLRGDQRFLDYNIEHESAVHLVLREGVGFEVYVDTPNGRNYVFEVDPSDRVEALKEKVHGRVHIPVEMQEVYLGERRLSETCTMVEDGVTPRCSLRVVLGEGYGRVELRLTGRDPVNEWVQMDQLVQTLKDLVANREHVAVRYVELRCGTTVMADDLPLSHYRLRYNQPIYVNIVQPLLTRVRVAVRGSSGTPFNLYEPVNSTILNIKQVLAQRLEGRVEDMQLFLEGRELENGQTLRESAVLEYSTLDLIHIPAGTSTAQAVRRSLHLFVKTLTGKSILVDVDPSDTVMAIKEQIRVQEGIPIPHQCLVIGGRLLDDSVRLNESGIQNQSVLHLVLRIPSQGTIHVTVLYTGRRIELTLMHDDTIGYLREQVERLTGTSRQYVSLVLTGQVLDDDTNSIADCDIVEGSTIEVQTII